MEREEQGAMAYVGAALVVIVILAVTVQATVGWSDVGAAWVQAVGSVLALFVTGVTVTVQIRSRRTHEARAAADRFFARIAVIELVAQYLGHYVEYQESLARGDGIKRLSARVRLRYALGEARLVHTHEMPTAKAVEVMYEIRSVVDLLSQALEIAGKGAVKPRRLQTMKKALSDMLRKIEFLKAEAERLKG